jgi:hypothetical protein
MIWIFLFAVMPGLVPGIPSLEAPGFTVGIAGTSPAMTPREYLHD